MVMLQGSPNILQTDVIPASVDADWVLPAAINHLEPRPVLIVTTPFTQGSGEEQQLTGILTAGCKLQNHQYHVVFVATGDTLAWYQLRQQLQPKVLLLFQVHPKQLGITALFRLTEVNRFDDCLMVPTYPLTAIMQDKALKLLLWNNALKPLFESKTYGEIL